MSNPIPEDVQTSGYPGNVSQAKPSMQEQVRKLIAESEDQDGWDKAW